MIRRYVNSHGGRVRALRQAPAGLRLRKRRIRGPGEGQCLSPNASWTRPRRHAGAFPALRLAFPRM